MSNEEPTVALDVAITTKMPPPRVSYIVAPGQHGACDRCGHGGGYTVSGPGVDPKWPPYFRVQRDAAEAADLAGFAYDAGLADGRRLPPGEVALHTAAELLLRAQIEQLTTAIHNFAIANDMRSPLGVRLMDEAARAVRLLVEVA